MKSLGSCVYEKQPRGARLDCSTINHAAMRCGALSGAVRFAAIFVQLPRPNAVLFFLAVRSALAAAIDGAYSASCATTSACTAVEHDLVSSTQLQ